ncbi:MAG TPA: beta-N-acetylhexosaminidase [Rhodopila sp.]|nr:beta-N-acetylhexosaminidase [Rhodopila sp.]
MTTPTRRAAVVGVEGPALLPREAALLTSHPPAGIILFGRNVQSRTQLSQLVVSLRQILPSETIFMVDQEGGRVARLRPPEWPEHPAAGVIGSLFATEPSRSIRLAWLCGALIGHDCVEAGIDVVAAPVLDRFVPGADAVIGDRAFHSDPVTTARLARSFASGLMAAGATPIGKHAPGHGRALVDSHMAMPRLADLQADDLQPFVLNAGLPWLMTAHIAFTSIDPASPATLSETVIREVIRGSIGFKGVLVTDDLSMKAMAEQPKDSARRALAAGCDLALYGAGDFEATEALLHECPPLTEAALARLRAAQAAVSGQRIRIDRNDLMSERQAILDSIQT